MSKRHAAAAIVAAVAVTVAALAVAGADSPSLTSQVSTDTSGYCTVLHSLGAAPSSVLLTPTINPGGVSYMLTAVAGQMTATSVKVRAMRASTQPLANTGITFSLLLFGTVAPPPTTTTAPPTTTTTPPVTTTTTTTTPPPPVGHPNGSTTGVPVGISLATVNGDLQVSTAGQVVDGKHVTGNLLVCADNVVIRNSQIDGIVANYACGNTWRPFTLTDSTVGPATGCISAETAVSGAAFTATRVHTRGVSDGFGVSANGPNSPVTVQDSFVELCGAAADHSDGIQLYLAGPTPVHFLHNTVVQLPCSKAAQFPSSWTCTTDAAQTAPIFVSDSSDGVDARDNLLIGGSSTIRVGTSANPVTSATVTGNAVVNNAWIYGPVDSNPCSAITWSNNHLVTVGADYQETSTVGLLPCSP